MTPTRPRGDPATSPSEWHEPGEVVRRLISYGETVACAESLTGGLVTARLVDTAGASAAVRGGVVAYASALKATLLGVDVELLAARGAVDAEVATQMASGVAARLGADWGLATTGVAGPDAQDGMPVGTVFVAVVGPSVVVVERLALGGDRVAIRRGAVDAVIALLGRAMGNPEVVARRAAGRSGAVLEGSRPIPDSIRRSVR